MNILKLRYKLGSLIMAPIWAFRELLETADEALGQLLDKYLDD